MKPHTIFLPRMLVYCFIAAGVLIFYFSGNLHARGGIEDVYSAVFFVALFGVLIAGFVLFILMGSGESIFQSSTWKLFWQITKLMAIQLLIAFPIYSKAFLNMAIMQGVYVKSIYGRNYPYLAVFLKSSLVFLVLATVPNLFLLKREIPMRKAITNLKTLLLGLIGGIPLVVFFYLFFRLVAYLSDWSL